MKGTAGLLRVCMASRYFVHEVTVSFCSGIGTGSQERSYGE